MTMTTNPTGPTDRTDPTTPRRLRTTLLAAAVSGGALFGAAQLGGVVSAQTDEGDTATTTTEDDTTAAECRELRQERREERRAEREQRAEELAAIIGIDAETLREQLRDGETLASIAAANDVDVELVVDHIVAERTASIAERVADGVIDQERADEILEGLEDRVTEVVNEGRPDRDDRRGPRGHRGGGGPFGEPPVDVED